MTVIGITVSSEEREREFRCDSLSNYSEEEKTSQSIGEADRLT